MGLSDHVNVDILISSASPSLPGFGVPMLAGVHSNFAGRRKIYTDPAAMLTDGFLTTDQIYLDAVALMSQSLKLRRFMVGRRETPVAQVTRVTLAGNADGNYVIGIDDGDIGGNVDYTHAASSETIEQIRDALIVLINAGSQLVTAAPGAGTDDIDLTADTAGIPFIVQLTSPGSDMTQAVQVANSGLAEDLVAITNEDPDWYNLLIPERDAQHILLAAAQIETQYRIFGCQSNEAAVVDTAYNELAPTGDVLSVLHSLGYNRTYYFYEPDDGDSLVAAVAGRLLPTIPGSNTWKFKALSGVAATSLTDTQLLNLRGDPQGAGQGKAGNAYTPLAGLNITQEGTMVSGEFIDTIRASDKLRSRIQFLVLSLFVNSEKVNFTNQGIAAIEGKVRQAIAESQADGAIAYEPAPTFTKPDALEIDSADKATRALSGGNALGWQATLSGAIHAVTIGGQVSP